MSPDVEVVMRKLYIDFTKTNFLELTSWFEHMGDPCVWQGLAHARGTNWHAYVIYKQFEIEITDEKLYAISCLRWA